MAFTNEESSLARNATAAAISAGFGEPADRDVHKTPGRPLRVLGEQFLEQRGVDRPRAQGVDPDPVAGELHPQLARHRQDPALGRGVRDLRGGRAHPGHEGRRVDDGALALGAHIGDRRLAAEEHGGQVGLLHPPPGLQAGVQDGVVVRRGDPRVVERDVDRTVGVERGLEEGVHLLGVGDVGTDEEPGGLGGDGLAALLVHIGADDVRALGGQPPGGGQADAAAGSGDDGGAADQAAADGRSVGHGAQASVLMKTFLVSVKAASASGPSSRPSPDCL